MIRFLYFSKTLYIKVYETQNMFSTFTAPVKKKKKKNPIHYLNYLN